MIAKALQKNVRISARKATLVCRLIRNKSITQALKILQNQEQKAAKYLFKLVYAAASNAINNHAMNGNSLYVYKSVANQARTLKRTSPRAKGRTDLIKRRFSHLEIHVSDDLLEKANLNKVMLKPRAHQYKYKNNQEDIKEIKSKKVYENSAENNKN